MNIMSSILLDFDGVIIQNKNIASFVATKSEQFIAKKYNLSCRESKKVNTVFYKTHGHTAIGIDPKKYREHILEYNDYVFSNINYSSLKHMITKQDEYNLTKLVCKNAIKKYGLFTNAPLTWCENICWMGNVDIYDFIEDTQCFTSDDGLIKPKKHIYDYVESELINDKTIYFVDDNKMNFDEIATNDRWRTFLFKPNQMDLHSVLKGLVS